VGWALRLPLIGFPNEEVARQQRIPLDEVKRVFQAFIDFGLIVYRPPAAALTWTMTSAIALATSSSVGGRS